MTTTSYFLGPCFFPGGTVEKSVLAGGRKKIYPEERFSLAFYNLSPSRTNLLEIRREIISSPPPPETVVRDKCVQRPHEGELWARSAPPTSRHYFNCFNCRVRGNYLFGNFPPFLMIFLLTASSSFVRGESVAVTKQRGTYKVTARDIPAICRRVAVTEKIILRQQQRLGGQPPAAKKYNL